MLSTSTPGGGGIGVRRGVSPRRCLSGFVVVHRNPPGTGHRVGFQIQRPYLRRERGREGGDKTWRFIASAIRLPTFSAVSTR